MSTATGALDRARHHDSLAQVELVDLEGDALFGPQAQEDVQLRSKTRPRCLKGTPTASNSRAYQPPHAQDEAPARDHVQAAQGLGGDHGIAEGQHEHARAELDLAGPRRHGAEVVIESMMGRRARRPGGCGPGPERLEAEGLGALGVGVEARDIRDLAGPTKLRMARPKWSRVSSLLEAPTLTCPLPPRSERNYISSLSPQGRG